MTVNKTATRAGKKFESDLVKYLREQGLDAEQLHLRGTRDEGDVVLRTGRPSPFVLEAKRTKAMDVSGWVEQAKIEAGHYAQARGLEMPYFAVVSARRNHGVGKAYAITELDEWLRQLMDSEQVNPYLGDEIDGRVSGQ